MAITNAQQARQLYKKGSKKPVEQAGVMNYMPSKMVTVPKIAKSSPDTPTAKLAYITPEEQDILIDLNLYGSLKGKPNRGPGGIPSLEGDFGGPGGHGGFEGGGGGRQDNDRSSHRDSGRGGGGDYRRVREENVRKAREEEARRINASKEAEARRQAALEFERQKAIRDKEEKQRQAQEAFAKRVAKEKADKIKAKEEADRIKAKEEEDAARQKELDKLAKEKQLSDLGKSKTDKFGKPIAKPKKTKYNSTTPNIFEQYLRNNLLAKTTEAITNSDFAYNLNAKQRENYLEDLKEKDLTAYNEVMKDLTAMGYVTSGVGPLDIRRNIKPTFKDLGEPQAKAILEGGRKVNINPNDPDDYDLSTNYTDTFNTTDNTGGGGDNYVPPIVEAVKKEETEEEEINPRDYTGLGARFMGSQFDFSGLADGGIARAGYMDGGMPEYQGGIMDLETGRQQYFLGKLVKKATRAIKKVAKSPFGKAALLYGLGSLGASALGKYQAGTGMGGKGILSKAGRYLLGTKGIDEDGGTMGLLGKFGLTGGFGGKMPTLKGGLALGLGVPTIMELMGGKEEEDQPMDLGPGIDINAIRNSPYRYLAPRFTGSQYEFADGGRIGYAEGSKEPVAKETMPLLDMDNQEMDLRAEGGFVPIGRMERADDVPARLSKNEFVFTADAVRNAGEGDIDKGAEVMYNMMKNLESGGEVSEESQGLDGAREMFQTSQRLEEVL